jgi:uncharacterized membrane protein HdeD (DUF308 family)
MKRSNALAIEVPRGSGQSWGWFLALGGSLGVLGVLGIAHSAAAAVASASFYGGVLVAAAVVECMSATMVGRWSGFPLHLLGVLLFAVTGLILLTYPFASPENLSALMAAYFIVGGAFEAIASLFMRLPDSNWHVLNGYVSVLLGVLALARSPISRPWAMGTFIGIGLLFRGFTWTAFAVDLRAFGEVSARRTRPDFGRR